MNTIDRHIIGKTYRIYITCAGKAHAIYIMYMRVYRIYRTCTPNVQAIYIIYTPHITGRPR